MTKNITYYSTNASTLAKQYDSVPFESVHKEWLQAIPKEGMVLDVGAGSGRDARYLAAKGLSVVAVEPAAGIREIAQEYTISNSIHWISDSLPELTEVFRLQTKFDLILLSAVWMHIAPTAREHAFRKLSSLLKPNKIILHLITSLPLLLLKLFNFKTEFILRISGYPRLNIVRRIFWKYNSF